MLLNIKKNNKQKNHTANLTQIANLHQDFDDVIER